MTWEKWANEVIGKLPVFDSKDEAIQAAIEANRQQSVHDIWQEPVICGNRFLVAAPQAFETLIRKGYERVLRAADIADIERGEYINEKRLAPDEGPNGIDRWTCNGYGLTINGKKVVPPGEEW